VLWLHRHTQIYPRIKQRRTKKVFCSFGKPSDDDGDRRATLAITISKIAVRFISQHHTALLAEVKPDYF
jgi:hypothetical protein